MSAWYGVEDEDRYECDWIGAESEHGPRLAEICAEHYHETTYGWTTTRPITLILYESETGPEIGRYEVARSDQPQFHAKEA